MLAVVASSFAALDTTRLLLYWPCDDGSGDTLTDKSGNGWDATIVEQGGKSEWVDSKYEKAIHLQKASAQVDGNIIGSTGDTGEITLMCWFIMYQHTTYNGLISIAATPGECDYRLMVDPNKNPFWNMGHHIDLKITSFTFELKKWYHYAMTGDGKTDKIYVNGESIGEQAEDFKLPDFKKVTVYLGTGEKPGTWTVEDATFDEVMIWDKALSADEIQEVMTGKLMAVNPMDKLATTWSKIKMEKAP